MIEAQTVKESLVMTDVIAELKALCEDMLPGAQRILRQYDPNNPEMDRASLLLMSLCDELRRRLGLGKCYLNANDGQTPRIAFERAILNTLVPRIRGEKDMDEIIRTIQTCLLEPALGDEVADLKRWDRLDNHSPGPKSG
jgi:hypothetical protein